MKKELVVIKGARVALIGGIVLFVLGIVAEYYFPYPFTKMAYIPFLFGGCCLGFGAAIKCINTVLSECLARLDEALPGIATLIKALQSDNDEATKDYDRKVYKKWLRQGRYSGFLALKVVEGPYIVELHVPCDLRLMSVYEIAEFRKFITAPWDGEEFHLPPLGKKEEESSGLC